MKILLMSSTPISKVFDIMKLPGNYNGGGWVEELISCLATKHEVTYACFWPIKTLMYKEKAGIEYYVIPAASADLKKVNECMCSSMEDIYQKCQPHVVHLFGTEFPWVKEVFRYVPAEKIVLHITGLISVYAQHYYGGLSDKELGIQSMRDMVRGGIARGQKTFATYGVVEKEILQLAHNVMGRTEWDKACVQQVNPNLEYYHCNEMLRAGFYEREWEPDKCNKYQVFVSAGNYPLKGAHQAIKAIGIVKKQYPGVKLVIAGNDIVRNNTLKDKMRMTTYGKCIRRLIKECDVEDNVIYVGPQDADKMLELYLQSHVYVLPSLIENSSNSLGEAMLLGMPCVAAYTGGTPDMLQDKKEGYLYPFDAYYMLAYYIMNFFEDEQLAVRFATNARLRAEKNHSKEIIYSQLMGIYESIREKSEGRE